MKSFFLFLLFSNLVYSQELPQVTSGTIERIENFQSNFVTSRNIDIWLPDDYSSTKQYNVLYMHDGQMLFDSTKTWNKQEWKVDEVASQLMQENKVNDFIVVAVWNIPNLRHMDLYPKKPYESLSNELKEKIQIEAKKKATVAEKPMEILPETLELNENKKNVDKKMDKKTESKKKISPKKQ